MNIVYRSCTPIDFHASCRLSGVEGSLGYFVVEEDHVIVAQSDLIDIVRPFIEYKFPTVKEGEDYRFSWSSNPDSNSIQVFDRVTRDYSRFYSILQYFGNKMWF